MQTFSKFLLRLWGFRLDGDPSNNLPHRIFAVIPHTSNWDFPLGLLVRSAAGIKVQFIAKDSLFKPPFGPLFRWLGGYPVDRTKSHNYVEAVSNLFQSQPRLAIAIAPEGTRKKVERLKTGFYHIARMAKVPIIMTKFDFGKKVVAFSEPLYPSGDIERDFQIMKAFYEDARGRNPELGYDFTIASTLT